MSETLPSQQNETQAWKRELQPHREINDRLNPNEALSLMGSFTEENLENIHELQDTMGEKDYQKSVRVKEAALSELSELDLEGVGVADAISVRKAQLEQEILEHAKRADIPSKFASTFKLEGLKDLESTYLTIDENIHIAGRDSTGMEAVKARAAHINEMISEHNERISPGSESIADSPEMREAQERINARFAEQQAKQPHPAETVDAARQKVAEAFGGTPETERQALIGEVTRAAKGSARIHTSVTKEAKLRFKGREDIAYNDGFSDFGEGLDWGTYNWRENGAFLSDTSEAFIFEPATTTRKKTVTETIETGGRFRKKTEQVQKEVADGEVPTMIVNPATGQQEPGVNVRYQFDGNTSNKAWGSRSLEKNDLPKYEAPDNNRGGNQLFIEVVLPKSVADSLQQAALRNPDVARHFAQSMVTENGATEATVKMPPYTELPADWTITVATLQKDTFSDRGRIYTLRNIANRQDVKV